VASSVNQYANRSTIVDFVPRWYLKNHYKSYQTFQQVESKIEQNRSPASARNFSCVRTAHALAILLPLFAKTFEV